MTIKNFDRNGGFKIDGFKKLLTDNAKMTQYMDLFEIAVAHTDLTQNAEIIGNAEMLINTNKFEKVIASMDLVIVRPNNFNNYLLYLLLHNRDFKKHAIGYCAGTTVLHLNKKAIQEYNVLLPNNTSIIDKISKSVENIIRKQATIYTENEKLTCLKNQYLKKFFG